MDGGVADGYEVDACVRQGEAALGCGFGGAADVAAYDVVDVYLLVVGADDADDAAGEGGDAIVGGGGADAFGVVGLEGGYVGGVGGDGDGARIGGVGVLPPDEVVACKGTGCEHDGRARGILFDAVEQCEKTQRK